MRKVIVFAFISLDGVIQAPGGPEEDPSGDFRLGGWMAPYAAAPIGQAVRELLSAPFELLLGRVVYDIFAGYWAHVTPDKGNQDIAEPFNRVRKYVATHRPDTLAWNNSHALVGDPADAVASLKRGEGPNLLVYGSQLSHQLLAAGLVDELRLVTFPIVLGHGKRLFGEDAQPLAFSLVSSATTSSGVVIARYAREGKIRTATFGAT